MVTSDTISHKIRHESARKTENQRHKQVFKNERIKSNKQKHTVAAAAATAATTTIYICRNGYIDENRTNYKRHFKRENQSMFCWRFNLCLNVLVCLCSFSRSRASLSRSMLSLLLLPLLLWLLFMHVWNWLYYSRVAASGTQAMQPVSQATIRKSCLNVWRLIGATSQIKLRQYRLL